MSKAIEVTLPDRVVASLGDLAREERKSEQELILEALDRYISIRQFRVVADRMTAKAEKMGVHSEQDVFDRVS